MDAETLKNLSDKELINYIRNHLQDEPALIQLFNYFESSGKSIPREILKRSYAK